jgi:hypothetical protein
LKSGGSRLVTIDNLSVQFDGLQALMYRLPAPIRFVFRFVPEVGHGERAFVDTQVGKGAIHARHYTGPGAICLAEIICKYMFLLIFYAYARSAGLRSVAMSFWMISQTSADGVGLAIIFQAQSSTERIGFKKNYQPDPWYRHLLPRGHDPRRLQPLEAMMGALDIDAVTSHYQALARLVPLKAITRESDYRKAVAALEALLDAGGADERHPLAGLVAVSGEFIDRYEKRSGQW